MTPYRSHRADGTQKAIVAALRQVGAVVIPVGSSGAVGAPDLFVAWQGRWFAMEVKSQGGKLSVEQQVLAGLAPVAMVKTIHEALEAIGIRP